MIKNFVEVKKNKACPQCLKHSFCRRGFSLIEMLFYISLFVIISIVVINSMIVMMKSFKETKIMAELTSSSNIMEKISREIRSANSIYSFSTTDIEINVKNDSGVNVRKRIALSGRDINFFENDVLIGNLNTANIEVASLTFSQISKRKGVAIKIFLTVRSKNDSQGQNEDFYNTIVLRGGY